MGEGNGNGNGTKVQSTRSNVTAYGKGRARRWRWAARVWREGAAQSEQIRRQGFASEQDANEDMERVLAAVREGKTATAAALPAEPTTITLGVALDRLLAEKARRKTVTEYGRIANHLREALGADTPLDKVTAARISQYRADRLANPSERTGRQLRAASVNRPLAVLRHLLKVAHDEWGLAPAPPRVRLEREEQGRLRWLTQEEAARLLAACSKSRNTDLLDLVTVSLYTGVRRSELLGLTWERVDRARGVIRLEVTKSGKRREIPFGTKVDAVLSRRAHAGTVGRVFPKASWDAYRTAFESAVAAAGIDDFKWHDLRHTYASWLVMAGRPLIEVKELLGHATIAMTMRYAHLAPERLRTAVAVLDEIELGAPVAAASKPGKAPATT
jgi:integrase